METNWDSSIQKLGDQIDDLQKSLETSQQLEQEQLQQLEIARQRLRFLTQGPDTAGLSELPKLLQTVMTYQTIGVIILGQDGKVLLFNSVADKIFGHSLADTSSHGVQSGCEIFLEDKTTRLAGFPWDKAVQGEDVPQMQLYVKRPDVKLEGMWISVTCTAMKGIAAGEVGGAVVLAVDLTEHVKISQQLGDICKQLESQINNIETAREEIKELADKLGKKGVVEAPAAVLSPLQRPPAAAAPSEPAGSENAPAKLALVVDDIPVNQKLLIMHLKKMGFQVESAFNGKDAVSMVQEKNYSLIFMDCDMPVMNGYEATIAIRQDELKTGKHVPIVAMTSYDRVGDRERCLSVGMDEYLTKGVTQKQLQEVVQWCLSRGTGAQEAAESTDKSDEADQKLDIEALVKTFGKYELEDILKLFLLSSTTLTSCLQFAIEDQDLESISHFAYSLKGPCASIGLTQIANISAVICKHCEEGRWKEALSEYHRLRRLYDLVRSQIEEASKEFQWVLV